MAKPINETHMDIITHGFGGDLGKESAYFRELFEILILEREATNNGLILNQAQLNEIEKRINEAKVINRKICEFIGATPLEDLKEEEVTTPIEEEQE